MEKDIQKQMRSRSTGMVIIQSGKGICKRIYDILPGWGMDFPPNYIFNDYYLKATKYLDLDTYVNISNKKYLKLLREENYVPRTWYEDEKIIPDPSKKYFMKNINLDNGDGISIHKGLELETIVKKMHCVQEEIIPKLINGYKFDIRVLICVCRDGTFLINDNFLYRVAESLFDENNYEKKFNVTNTACNKSPSTFFYYNKLQNPTSEQIIIKTYHDIYLKQIQDIIPNIYSILLNYSNKTDQLKKPENHYYIHGLDFIANADNKIYFLEINSPPGHCGGAIGIYNYQQFIYDATDFITNKK